MAANVPTGPDTTNAETLDRIREVVTGGASSSMRAAAIPRPLVVSRAKGCEIWDVEGNRLIDFNMGYGPHIFGYADREVLDEVAEQFALGHMTGFPHPLDEEAGRLLAAMVPGIEQVRFANSGTEAVQSALRLARAATGRTLVVTFEGHYHGWSETVFRAGKLGGEAVLAGEYRPAPGAPGMIPGALEHTLQIPFNDPEAATVLFERYSDRIAGVILEPVMANSGVVPPIPGFLEHLRDLTVRHGALLIFDEVITGLRVGRESAQGRYGVTPDLTILSKVLGGGFPVAAFGGSREVMAPLADGRAMHAGVYAGNHAALRAVVATLRKIQRETDMYERLESLGAYTESALRTAFAAEGRDVLIGRVGSVMAVSLLTRPVAVTARRAEISAATDSEGHRRLQMFAQAEGVYFHPIPHETWFLSTEHTFDHVDKAVSVIRRGLAQTA